MRYTKPTPAIKCKTKDCDQMARILSMHDEPRKFKDGQIVDYDRITKWRCDNGHLSETQAVYKPKPAEPQTRPRKKPTQKGYQHVVNKPKHQSTGTVLTNHQRHKLNQERRAHIAKMKTAAPAEVK